MDGVNIMRLGNRNDAGNVEIGLDRSLANAYLIGFIGLEAMERQPIFLRIDSHGAQAEFVGRAENANGDFTAIGREQFANWLSLGHEQSSSHFFGWCEILHCFTSWAHVHQRFSDTVNEKNSWMNGVNLQHQCATQILPI